MGCVMMSVLCFFLSGLSNIAFCRFTGVRGSQILTMALLHAGLFSGLLLWYEVFVSESYMYYDMGSWFMLGALNVNWGLYVDLSCAHLLLTVCVISYAVHVYSYVYMKDDPHLPLFISYLSFFSFFMMYLACSTDLFGILVGWEGIGVFSYLLIGYYTHRLSASKSALKAVVVNRISDGFLLWGILGLYWYSGSVNLDVIGCADGVDIPFMYGLAILIGAMGKSAQIGLHVWLADAMEGPTPVSALLHAACIVCAGVFVMVRLNLLYSDYIILIGCLTALMASIFGLFQTDLKRVIAFSTCSQLGYMMVSIGLGEYGADASMGHLMSHASFKAALFLSAGVIIMAAGHNQQFARYGSLSALHCSILCLVTMLIASLSLMGFVETSGFYSKETIINYTFVSFSPLADYAHYLLITAALFTSMYTIKLFIQSFLYDFSGYNLTVGPLSSVKHAFITMALSALLLDVVLKIWVGTNLLSGILFFIPWGTKTIPFGLMIAGILTASVSVTSKALWLVRFCASRWGFDQLYARTVVHLIFDLSRITWGSGDKGLFMLNGLRVR